MKYLLALLCGLAVRPAEAQQPRFTVRRLALPPELAYYDNQFSGLAVSAGQLFLLSESRLQDHAPALLYTVPLPALDRQLADSTAVLPYQKLPLLHLEALRAKMSAAGQHYEGLEALLIDRDEVYLSVETNTPSTSCYLLKGALRAGAVVLDTTFLVALPKPLAADGAHIYNAGFEALAALPGRLLAFFEFNSFPRQNYAYELNERRLPGGRAPRQRPVAELPFRITDLTAVGHQHFTALNFFFKGEGDDAVYRTPANDLANARLIRDKAGAYRSYARLLDVERRGHGFVWRPLWEFPEPYWGYNWEGIAAYKGGYFVINDKYTPSRPYQSTLLYLQPAP